MTTNINNSPEYACRTCAKQECGCKDTECQLPCHFYTEQAEQEPVSWIYEDELPKGYPYDEMFSRSKIIEGVRMFPEVQTEQSTVKESLTAQDHIRDATKIVALTTEQAQQIEEALEDIVRVFKFETGTPVEALASIRAARAQEQAEQDPVSDYFDFGLEEVEDYLRNCCNSPFMADKLSEIRKSISEPFAYAFSKNETWLFSLFEQPDSIPLYAAPVRTKDLTYEEAVEVIKDLPFNNSRVMDAMAVIAAYKEKNK